MFAGVQPLASYKDGVVSKWDAYQAEQQLIREEQLAQAERDKALAEVEAEIQASEEQERATREEEKRVKEESEDKNDYAIKFNQYRQTNGLAPLIFTDDLNQVAELRLKELSTNFSHYSVGNYNENLAENIASVSFGPLSNSDALAMWQTSPGHKANMLDKSYKHTGYAIGNGYAIQVFTEYNTVNGVPQLPPGWYWGD